MCMGGTLGRDGEKEEGGEIPAHLVCGILEWVQPLVMVRP